MWRRSLNGFNDAADPKALERDLQLALRHFRHSASLDRGFAEATVGAIGSLQGLAYLNRENASTIKSLVPEFVRLFEEARSAAPHNPRWLWVLGAQQWFGSTTDGGRQDLALSTYAKGLRLAREQKGTPRDPLEPSWGEPELLMSLAWANLHRATPDVRAAEQYAREALALVPYWRYVRDRLLPQIQSAGQKRTARVRIMAVESAPATDPDDRPVRTISRDSTNR